MNDYTQDALTLLSANQVRLLRDQITQVPARPGLYAIYGNEV